jgi:SAM-dependent methyltransferase
VAEWSLPREDLCLRVRAGLGGAGSGGAGSGGAGSNDRGVRVEAFRPPPHERSAGGLSSLRVRLRRFADLQFGSIWRDLERLLPQVEGTLIDVGAGAQPFRDLLPPTVRYIAVDIDEAERRFGYRTPGTRYFRGEVLPVENGEANTVLCTETLEHVRGTAQFLGELRRALAPGGLLVLTVPFAARWHFIPQDFWRFTPSGLEHLLTGAGFRDVRVYARGGALAVACYKVLGLIFLMLAGGGRRGIGGWVSRAAGVALLPVGAVAVVLGNAGIRVAGAAEDTLGYTVLAC